MKRALEYRKPLVFIIDEGQHLARISKGRLEEQFDCIKSIANMTGVKHILFGTYDLRNFRNKSAQLNNRSLDIHFRRYDASFKEDWSAFVNVIATLESFLPLKEDSKLPDHSRFLYERTVGCVGVLKRWLTHALRLCLKSGSEMITLRHLLETAPTIGKALQATAEILTGEEDFTNDSQGREKLLSALQIIEPPEDTSGQQKRRSKGKNKPGKQNPRRHFVPDDAAIPGRNEDNKEAA